MVSFGNLAKLILTIRSLSSTITVVYELSNAIQGFRVFWMEEMFAPDDLSESFISSRLKVTAAAVVKES